MSTQINKPAWNIKTILQIATIGFYEPEKSLTTEIQREDGPGISVGTNPLRGPYVFYSALDGCVDPKNRRTDLLTYFHCSPEEVHIRNLESWQKTLNNAVTTIMMNQGLAGHFTCELAELAVLSLCTDSKNFFDPSAVSPADKKAKRKVATAIVIANPENEYSGGKIRIKSAHHGKHQDYDLETNSKKGLISVLLCFDDPGTKVETEPVRDGHRLHLIYNVYIVKPEGLTITSTKRMGQLSTNVERLTLNPSFKSTTRQNLNPVFLRLLQILVQTYKSAPEPPAVVLQFYCQIIEGLYKQTLGLFPEAKPYPANVRAPEAQLLFELRVKVRYVIGCLGGTKSLYETIALYSQGKAKQCATILLKLGFANEEDEFLL